jgi:hypothetical protein
VGFVGETVNTTHWPAQCFYLSRGQDIDALHDTESCSCVITHIVTDCIMRITCIGVTSRIHIVISGSFGPLEVTSAQHKSSSKVLYFLHSGTFQHDCCSILYTALLDNT